MEDPTPEQVEALEGGCSPWEAHAGASSRPDRWTREEGSPRQGRFAGRTCDPVGDPTLEQFAPEDKGRAVDIVYLDFSKAFDTVSHKTLTVEQLMDWAVYCTELVPNEAQHGLMQTFLIGSKTPGSSSSGRQSTSRHGRQTHATGKKVLVRTQ
ncbi:hypothetical protein GRJ2_000520500 [Grus japonensis]|uniref:Reverse transcriptase domain-containing protein n=1 Tax=Grus japonensis TaxID=30415 RepID=A0ABC9W6X0_GRUJA